jgi:hypothetical protein
VDGTDSESCPLGLAMMAARVLLVGDVDSFLEKSKKLAKLSAG